MTEARYIHGGTDAREVARLEKQARWLGGWMLQRFDAAAGMRVLDLATGVGAMAGQLLERSPGIALVGVDLSPTQLKVARERHPAARYVRADATALPFADDSFDRVHCSWLLEHVSGASAVRILREVRRVLAPGAYCQFTEVDNSTFRTEPSLPRVVEALAALNAGQQRAGGDPFVARRLPAYFAAAGFARVDVRPSPVRGDARDPVFFQGFVDEFVEIFESVDEALGAPLAEAAAELRRLPQIAGASIHYCGSIAQAWK